MDDLKQTNFRHTLRKRLEERMKNFEPPELVDRVAAQERITGMLNVRLEQMERQLTTKIDERFDQLHDAVADHFEVVVSMIDERTSLLETQVSTLTTNVATLKTDISSLKTDVGTLKTDVNSLTTDVATLKTEFGTLRSEMSGMEARLLEAIRGGNK